MHFSQLLVSGLTSTRMLYGVHVRMKLSRMADSVRAAFDSCRFSCDFFFFLPWRAGFRFFGMIFAFSGMRMSGACENRRPSGRLYSESRVDSGRRPIGGGPATLPDSCEAVVAIVVSAVLCSRSS